MIRPIRLQLSRKKGFDLQAISLAANGLQAVNVARPSKWGNPFTEAGCREAGFEGSVREIKERCVEAFRVWLGPHWRHNWDGDESAAARDAVIGSLRSLRGKNLACWCPLTLPDGSPCPCHADVLLEIANG